MNFNQAGVPSLSFTTGAHTDYHKPSDTADKIAYEDLDRVAGFAAAIARRRDGCSIRRRHSSRSSSRRRPRRARACASSPARCPTTPPAVKGLLLGGVVGGGPAEQAGLQKGDVIVEIAGQAITNIYDYTYALDLLKIGQPVKVVYMRGAERRETTLTPAARR